MSSSNEAPRTHFDVIVAGTGGVGSAAVYHLAKRGVTVLGLDRFPAAHSRGSSHGVTRVIRKAYFEHPDYVPLLHRAYELWDELDAECEAELFRRHPMVEIGPPDGIVVPGVLNAARKHRLEVNTLTVSDFANQFPNLRLPDGCVAVTEADAGFLYVERCVREHLEKAEQMGANLVSGLSVLHWSANDSSVEVVTDSGTFSASKLIITAGAWTNDLLSELGVELKVIKKHLHWFEGAPSAQADSGFPIFFYETDDGMFYGVPAVDNLGIKIAEHTGGTEITNPFSEPRELEKRDATRIEKFAGKHFNNVSPNRTRHDVCFYTMSPDGNFIIDRHPRHPSVTFAAGLSGHGFKFAGVLGEALADLSLSGRTALPMEFLNLSRFDREG